ncbi:Os03g0757051 [Oryza sativa Japonica Group]|uniref:Os03g0757051 protein n=1 Tax=Oryza sativa subsp. japonica TaxID=39947 RepID=A0A0P0W3W0_ORYSJ|nr:Os03g0757051 [Oryza sativa Japonica Group]
MHYVEQFKGVQESPSFTVDVHPHAVRYGFRRLDVVVPGLLETEQQRTERQGVGPERVASRTFGTARVASAQSPQTRAAKSKQVMAAAAASAGVERRWGCVWPGGTRGREQRPEGMGGGS